MTIQLGGTKANHRVYGYRGLAQDILVGVDFFKTHKCVLNFNTDTLYTGKGETKISFQSLNQVYRVRAAETIVLAPTMVTDVPCRVQEDINLEGIEGVVESGGSLEGRYSAGVLRTAVTVRNGLFAVRVFNPSDKPVRVHRCSLIGTLHPLVEHNVKLQRNGAVCVTGWSTLYRTATTQMNILRAVLSELKSSKTLLPSWQSCSPLITSLSPVRKSVCIMRSLPLMLTASPVGQWTLAMQKECNII